MTAHLASCVKSSQLSGAGHQANSTLDLGVEMDSLEWPAELTKFVKSLPDNKLKELSKYVNRTRKGKYAYHSHHCETKAFLAHEKDAFFCAFKRNEFKQRMAFRVQCKTLRRISEIAPLNLAQVNLEKRFIVFRLAKQRNDTHKVHIADDAFYWELVDYIEAYRKRIDAHMGYLFYSENPTMKRMHMSPDYLRNFFRKICKRAGLLEPYATSKDGRKLYRLSTHSFRNEGIEKGLFELGTPIPVMQKIIGHKDVSSLMKYAKRIPPELLLESTKQLQKKL